ncbi:MAG: hypothetical protein ABW061_06890 [Polyangiaceae bacterium]
MSIHRRPVVVALACSFGSLLSACASPQAVVPVRYTASEGPQVIEFEAPPAEPNETLAPNPYAPKHDSDGPHYSWQSATPVKCAPDAEKPAVLTFSGSVGVFPLLSDEELERAQLAADAPPPSGKEEPSEVDKRASSPDLVVAALRPRFRQCFSRWLDAKADAEGSVRLALELGCAGNVQAINAEVRGVDEPTLACLFTVVGPAQFGPPVAGHATIQVPVVFKNAAR